MFSFMRHCFHTLNCVMLLLLCPRPFFFILKKLWVSHSPLKSLPHPKLVARPSLWASECPVSFLLACLDISYFPIYGSFAHRKSFCSCFCFGVFCRPCLSYPSCILGVCFESCTVMLALALLVLRKLYLKAVHRVCLMLVVLLGWTCMVPFWVMLF